jgi:hypothetical protein
MAFIAGMAVMLAVLLPFVKPREPTAVVTHGSIIPKIGAGATDCMQCHVSIPKGPAPAR